MKLTVAANSTFAITIVAMSFAVAFYQRGFVSSAFNIVQMIDGR